MIWDRRRKRSIWKKSNKYTKAMMMSSNKVNPTSIMKMTVVFLWKTKLIRILRRQCIMFFHFLHRRRLFTDAQTGLNNYFINSTLLRMFIQLLRSSILAQLSVWRKTRSLLSIKIIIETITVSNQFSHVSTTSLSKTFLSDHFQMVSFSNFKMNGKTVKTHTKYS